MNQAYNDVVDLAYLLALYRFGEGDLRLGAESVEVQKSMVVKQGKG